MKRINWIFSTVVALTFAATAQAQVPSLINYQGRLTDKAGTPVNGPVNIGIKIFDAATEGKAYYTEDIGEVTVVNGVYSFNYGAGKSEAKTTETIGTGNGTEKVFAMLVSKAPIVGKVSITDGISTWISDGSTTQSEILGTVDNASGNVTAIFLKTAPDNGTAISVTYEHDEEGVFGALQNVSTPWLELSINGKSLTPRQRLVSVPFAVVAGKLLEGDEVNSVEYYQSSDFDVPPEIQRALYGGTKKVNWTKATEIKETTRYGRSIFADRDKPIMDVYGYISIISMRVDTQKPYQGLARLNYEDGTQAVIRDMPRINEHIKVYFSNGSWQAELLLNGVVVEQAVSDTEENAVNAASLLWRTKHGPEEVGFGLNPFPEKLVKTLEAGYKGSFVGPIVNKWVADSENWNGVDTAYQYAAIPIEAVGYNFPRSECRLSFDSVSSDQVLVFYGVNIENVFSTYEVIIISNDQVKRYLGGEIGFTGKITVVLTPLKIPMVDSNKIPLISRIGVQ